MRVAILIGVSQYQSLVSLPACKSDAELMKKLLGAMEQYDELLCLSENTHGTKVKENVTAFIKNQKGKQVEEVFFYYTGHGEFHENEFYYQLSDFEKDKRKRTSIENSEVDNWLRSLCPELTIKVVDACHAGVTYVKEDDQAIKKYLEEIKGSFKKCYFMFSSKVEQGSYQDTELSYFTRSFAKALQEHPNGEIRYKDIIDFISDDFVGRPNQTPFFIAQADFTEAFCSINPKIKNLVSSTIGKAITESEKSLLPQVEDESLEKLVTQDAHNYFSEDAVMKILEEVKEKIENHKYPANFKALFEVQHLFESDYSSTPKRNIVGKWLDSHRDEYFAKVEEEEEQYQVEVPATTPLAFVMRTPYITQTKYRRRISGFHLTVDCPYKIIKIDAEPKYPNISWSNCTIVFLLSKTTIRFFYFYVTYREKNWKEQELPQDVNWETTEGKFRDKESIFKKFEDIQNRFVDQIIDQIKERFANAKSMRQEP